MPTDTHKQPWLHRPVFDGVFILLPGFLALLITMLLPQRYKYTDEMPLAAWVILILLIDVAHVYSTLFRTYWDKERLRANRLLFLIVPLACYVAGVLIYAIDGLFFWRVLAYLAVWHFIRQQYGFMRLYSRLEPKRTWASHIDAIAIYAATLYPIIYWHCTPDRNFNWFLKGDFIISNAAIVRQVAGWLYLAIIVAYVAKEVINYARTSIFNLPRNLIIMGTFLTWYVGIVYFNGDMAFTLLNVVAHGIPYMALVYIFRQRERSVAKQPQPARPLLSLAVFIVPLLIFAWVEEGLWDGLVWREHDQVFGLFNSLPLLQHHELLALTVPLLSLPQATHYVLDGFIWRRAKERDK